MDMVVTTSNTLAHVAGALGVETHILMPLGKGRLWYWFGETTKSPWYGSVTLHRQTTPGEWADPVADLNAHLDSRLGSKIPLMSFGDLGGLEAPCSRSA
jgi:hypothetical protein